MSHARWASPGRRSTATSPAPTSCCWPAGCAPQHGFLDQLAEHTSGLTEPAEALVEGIAFAVETLADDPQFANVLRNGSKSGAPVSLTSDTAKAFSRSMLHRCDVDWESHGFDEAALDELAELGLRTFHSMLVDPGEPARDGFALRRFISRWLGPAIVYPRLTQIMEALQPVDVRPQRSRPTAAS